MTPYIERLAIKIAQDITENRTSTRTLANRNNVSIGTVRRALEIIRDVVAPENTIHYVAERGRNGYVMLTSDTEAGYAYIRQHMRIADKQNERVFTGTIKAHRVLSIVEAEKENAERNQSQN